LLALRAWFLALERTVTTGEVARAALALIEPDDALSRSFALLPLGHAQPTNGDLVGSTQTFREAYDEGKRANFRLALPGALYNLAFNLNEQGQRRTALALCEEALARFVDRRGKSLPLAGLAYVPLAVLHYAANELPLAHMYAQKGLELSRPTISGMILGGDAEYILAQVHVAHGERKAALTLLRTMRAAAQHSGMARVADTLWASEADLYLRIGELAPAAHWATTLGFTPDGIAVATSGRHALIYIRLLMAQGYWHDAQTVAARFAAHAHDQGRQLWLIHVQLLQAAIARQFGDGAKATQACRRV
jgi:ATP/maltotriose-dependent transcriptional regulator MalT